MHESLLREVVTTAMRQRESIVSYAAGALERIMNGIDLSLPNDRLLSEVERRMHREETPRA